MMRLILAVADGLGAEPHLNAWYEAEREAVLLHDHMDLGVAVDTPDGLFVPVLRNIARRSLADLRRGLDRLRADVRARTVPAAELRGATFTLSNFGPLGGRHAALSIVPPQVGILGAGRAWQDVVALEGSPAVRWQMPLSLTFDHRVVTGGEAARFLRQVVASLALPASEVRMRGGGREADPEGT